MAIPDLNREEWEVIRELLEGATLALAYAPGASDTDVLRVERITDKVKTALAKEG